jgi:hypothetical protein
MFVLPGLTLALVAYAVRPAAGDLRLAAVRAAVIVGAVAAVLVEALSAVRALTPPVLAVFWLCALVPASGAAVIRYRRDGGRPAVPRLKLNRPEKILVLAVGGLMLAELLVALVSPPNNYDSQTYHLPKIEHWVVQRDVDFFPTRIHRQVTIAPGAEYLLLHLRLLTGGDGQYNLLQWCAGVGCVLAASRIAKQLGGDRRAQLITALVAGTTPILALEASSTQTDLVVAGWVACVATLVLDELRRPTSVAAAALIGAATGLTALTKATGLLGAGPLLLVWAVAQARRAPLRLLVDGLVVAALAAALAGPYLYRLQTTYDNPLGPDYLRNSISMQRHDPAAVLVNALHIGHTALETPLAPLNDAAARAVDGLARALHVDPGDQRIVFWGATFPTLSWPPDEDRASFPVQGTLVLLGAVVLLLRRGRPRLYAAAFLVSVLAYVATVKWQPWGNRLILFLLVLGAPLAGLWLAGVLTRPRRTAAWAAILALTVGACAGWLAVGFGWPRRLVGHGSIFTESRIEQRFNRRPQWLGDYLWAADAVRAAGAHRVGLVQGEDTWEYPWWVLLHGADIEPLQTLVPGHQPVVAPKDTDAIVCVADVSICRYYTPPGWQLTMHGTVGYALRPR